MQTERGCSKLPKKTERVPGDMWITSNYVQEYVPVRQCFRMPPVPWLKSVKFQKQSIGFLLPWQVKKINNYIDKNLARRIRLCELAKICRLSNNYFSHVFANTFGCSPNSYIIQRRLERVQESLRTGDRALSDLALAYGFSDQPHLTRLFRQYVGMTPGEWRQKVSIAAEIR